MSQTRVGSSWLGYNKQDYAQASYNILGCTGT